MSIAAMVLFRCDHDTHRRVVVVLAEETDVEAADAARRRVERDTSDTTK